jgi:hypothetical protein
MRVTLEKTATYRLHIRGRAGQDVVRVITVQVTAGTCTISGRVSGLLQFDIINDRGQHVPLKLTHVYITTPGAATPMRARIDSRQYEFSNIPAGKTYTISPPQLSFRAWGINRVVQTKQNLPKTGFQDHGSSTRGGVRYGTPRQATRWLSRVSGAKGLWYARKLSTASVASVVGIH